MDKTYEAKSVIISRKPAKDEDSFKTAWIGLFKENNPHLKGRAPFEVLEFPETEKVRIRELRNISYYLLGNDIVINNLQKVKFSQRKNILEITGNQNFPK